MVFKGPCGGNVYPVMLLDRKLTLLLTLILEGMWLFR